MQISAAQGSYSQIATTHALYRGLTANAGASYTKFHGLLMTGSNGSGNCSVNAGATAPGINGACGEAGLSVGLLTTVTGVSAANSFVGKISDEPVNTSHELGVAAYPTLSAIFDWFGFVKDATMKINLFRGWGRENAAAFPASAHRGTWTSGNGRIWDFSLLATDTSFLGKSNDGTNPNDAIVADMPCPAWLSGDDFLSDMSLGEPSDDGSGNDNGICEAGEICEGRHFLRNAIEVVGDRVGNDNGLCESGETCIATPNLGAYQGHGDYRSSTCVFQNGTTPNSVVDVQMHFYPDNGVTP